MPSQIVSAYLLRDPTPEEKEKLQFVGATWSSTAKGWFITQEQKDRMDSHEASNATVAPSVFKEDTGSHWRVWGKTYDKRDTIKALGGTWKPSTKSWEIPKANVTEEELDSLLK